MFTQSWAYVYAWMYKIATYVYEQLFNWPPLKK